MTASSSAHSRDAARRLSEAPSRNLVMGLAGLAGLINAAGFHAIGHFSSHLSGTVAVLSDELANARWGLASLAVWVVLTFILGAMATAVLMIWLRETRRHGRYARCLILEAVALIGVAVIDRFTDPDPEWFSGLSVRILLLTGSLSFLMGFQNAIVTQISHARIRTTHVTGMITDIGVALGQRLTRALRPNWHVPGGFGRNPLTLHLMTVGAFVVGGVIGVLGYRWQGTVFLLVVSVGLLSVGLYDLWRRS